jgi:uncharacterized metal-binding protein YceD (DUF177 family)
MAEDLPISLPFPVRGLPTRKAQRFDLKTTVESRALLAALLGITAVHSLRFKGEIRPLGRNDFELIADLQAQIEQPCTVSLQPVLTDITETVTRRYLSDLPEPEADEMEVPEDDTTEPLPDVIDAGAVAAEALALALPAYPRAPGQELGTAVFGPEGQAPLTDEAIRPFAGLAGLAAKLGKPTDSES